MVFRGVSGAHVCWRCQLHLLKPSTQTESAFRVHPRRLRGLRLQHNGAWSGSVGRSITLPRESKGLRTENDHAKLWASSNSETPNQEKRERYRAWRPLIKKVVKERPLGRLHGFRGHKLRENAAELNVNSLGKPAEVIVLRDAGFRFNPPREMEELKVAEKVDILAQLDAERGLVGQADVEKSIEEFKPKSKTITWDALQSIQRQLVAGFTTAQLVKYIEAFERRKKNEKEQQELESRDDLPGAILRKTSWVPGTSETGEEFDDSVLRGYRSEALTPKLRLVLLMLRQYWQLEAQEVIESIGEVELEIRNKELELLIFGKIPPLRLISNKLIASQDEHIEAFRSRGVIRVTAAKEKSEIIVQEIHDILQGVHQLEVDLNALELKLQGPRIAAWKLDETAYDDSVIDELAQLTETQITRLPNNLLTISCINTKAKVALSTRADIARRLLLTSSEASDRTKTQQGCKEIAEPLISVKYHMTDDMSWRNRLRQWVRWTSAVSKSTAAHREPDDTPQQGIEDAGTITGVKGEGPLSASSAGIPVSIDPSQKKIIQPNTQTTSEKLSEYVFWDRQMFTATSAIIGHLLHEVPAKLEVAPRRPADAVPTRSIFFPTVMNISRLLGTMPSLHNLPDTSLVMRFIPSPWTVEGPEMLTSLPNVEMRFKVNEETKELELKDVIAVVESTASDIMIPDRALDLRFYQRTTSRLRTLHHRQLPEISEFLEASQLNLMRGRLETPPGLTLPIATYLCDGELPETLLNSRNDSIDVQYIFAGLEYRSTLAFDFEGWKLLYTSVEGGKADGRRGELKLRPLRMTNDISDEEKTSATWTEKFIETAHRLVDILENSDTPSVHCVKPLIKSPTSDRRADQNKAFGYFNQVINFMEHAREDEEDNDVGFEDVAETRRKLSIEPNRSA